MIRESPSEAERGRGREWRRLAGRWVRGLHRLADRLLHPFRRRAARARVAARCPASVLVVCNGNIFRSPFAAALLARELGGSGSGDVAVESAGLLGPGRPAPREAVLAAKRHGIDLENHRSQLVTVALARAADLIVVMEPGQRRILCQRFGRAPGDVLLLGDFDPAAITSRAVDDPWEQGPAVCEAVYERIARCGAELAAALRGTAG